MLLKEEMCNNVIKFFGMEDERVIVFLSLCEDERFTIEYLNEVYESLF